MSKRSNLCENMNLIQNSEHIDLNQKIKLVLSFQQEIEIIEDKICEISSKKNANVIKNNFRNLSDEGIFSLQKMWKSKRAIDTKFNSMPIAMRDKNGQIVTTKSGILTLYEQEYRGRLSKNPPHPGYESLQILKEYLFNLRVKISALEKSPDWEVEDIVKISRTLKNSKARDNEGLIFELFKPQNCGSDVS